MKNRNEDRAIGLADRNRSKASATARTLEVRETTRQAINAFVMALPEADRDVGMQEAINHLGTLYSASQGPAATGSLFGKLSKIPIVGLSRAIASARAEQLFAPKAANDRGEG